VKLRGRIAAVVAAVVAATITLTVGVAAFSASAQALDPVDDVLRSRAEFIAEVSANVPDGFVGGVAGRPQRGAGIAGIDTARRPGDPVLMRLVLSGGVVVSPEELPFDLLTGSDLELIDAPLAELELSTRQLDGQSFRFAAMSTDDGAIFLAQDITPLEEGVSALLRRLVLTGLVGVALAVGVGWLVARRIAEPIVRVSDAARNLAANQDLPSRISTSRSDEVGELADSFNDLVDALQTSRRQQHQLVADASHELRTPLTSLRLRVETLAAHPDLDAERRGQLTSAAVVELESLTELVSELVELATDVEHSDEKPVDTDLGALVSAVAEKARLRTGRTVEVTFDSTWLQLRPKMTARAVSNLIDNAVKYSPDDTAVQIDQAGGRVEVSDRGVGLDADGRARAFERFYRAPSAQLLPGSGIGLAIVRHVADSHDGSVWFEPREGGGSSVGFELLG
jgi:two-component system sensor histidine kinase MprB